MKYLDYLIITPTYKRDKLLMNNILSVQQQNYQSYLHLIVDDDNSQKTKELISTLADSRIIYLPRLRSANDLKTCSNAINHGLNYITSNDYTFKYIKILHDDDMLYKDVLKRHAKYLSNNSIGMVHGKEIRWDQEKGNYEIKGVRFSSNPKILKLKVLANYIQYTTITYLYKEFIKIKSGGRLWYKPNQCYGEDKDVTARYLDLISKDGYKVYFDENICSIYRKSGSDRITSNTNPQKIQNDIKETIRENSSLWQRPIIKMVDYLERPLHVIPKKLRDKNKYIKWIDERMFHKRIDLPDESLIYWWL